MSPIQPPKVREVLEWSSPRAFCETMRMWQLFRRVSAYTMVRLSRLKALYRLAQELDRRGIAGAIVECGVFNGGSAAVLAYASRRASSPRPVWLFDSFQGLPKPTAADGQAAHDQYRLGWCQGDVAKVKEVFRRVGIPLSRLHLVKGWFQDTFPKVCVQPISLLHIDADWYESVKLCLEKFYDAVEPGGFVVLDDYGWWEGCRLATDQFLQRRGVEVQLIQVDVIGYYFEKPLRAVTASPALQSP
jgi:O-methyltransferase